MAISADKNINYGGDLVNQKYRPLDNIVYDRKNKKYYGALLDNRWNQLMDADILPKPLLLATSNWRTIIRSEAGKRPPLVVISSNRSKWIKQGIEAANQKLLVLDERSFRSASDLRALMSEEVSPPIYCRTRIAPGTNNNRNIYIVVNISEYETYKNNLAGTGITVIGWVFKRSTPHPPPNRSHFVGFGASRFAAIQFCKELRTAATPPKGDAPWDYAWLFDDNVVALGKFPGYGAIEDKIKEVENCVSVGFSGGTKAEEHWRISAWAQTESANGRGQQSDTVPNAANSEGLIQQAALWNIKYLTDKAINFSPVYISSAEDVSFVNYFKRQKISYLFYKGISVVKERVSIYDQEINKVNSMRQGYTAWFSDAENSGVSENGLPPPVMVDPQQGNGEQKLSDFIVNHVLPDKMKGDFNIRHLANSQAVEQITSGAIEEKVLIEDRVIDRVFKISGISVDRRDMP
ncbi:hypothetical protein [Leptothoe spongobia]|uniref:Uncharacterized protein n=1 Tax=Leptothoe spongobia TAU-MAC 1115 TaxID=1967444 RepID=A0A947DCU7_9CYAN|nr:hypothetical protein [Leptothoe spongobia]MBT9314054.1 hypothetical protein [Leptothoe spongobia TAU-MAC 1115]